MAGERPALIPVGRTDRVRSFDLARGLAVGFMILVHVLWHWGRPEVIGSPFGTVISFLGGPPAAPVFMTLMGVSLAFSSHADPRSLARRGVLLVAAGYLLNIVRGAIPATLGLATGVVTAEEIEPFTPLWLLTAVDILQLAGGALILIAGLRLVSPAGPAWLAVAVGLVLLAPVVRGLATGVPALDAILGPILGGPPNAYYALFPWAMYPIVGAVAGEAIARSADRAATIRSLGLVGIAACAAGVGAIAITRPGFDVATYWHHPPAMALAIAGFVLAWLWTLDLAVRRLPELAAIRFLEGAGRRVTVLYVIHWLIVGWGVGLVGFQGLSLIPVVAAMAATVVLTWFLGTRPRPARRLAVAGA